MSSFNKVILMGNLTRTPELRSTATGSQVTDVTLAVNDSYTGKDGGKVEQTTFVDITFWGKQAETLCRWKKQGDPLLVEGALRQDKWVDKQSGQNRTKLKVQGLSFTFLGGGKGKQERPQADQNESYDDYATSLPKGGDDPLF